MGFNSGFKGLRAALIHAGRRKDRQTNMAKLIVVYLG